MTPQRTDYPFDYRNGSLPPHDRAGDLADAVSDRVKEATDGLQERAGQVAEQALRYAELAQDAVKQFKPFVRQSIKEKPMATLASFLVVGFVLGAMWKK
jgi:hypothetical protein